MKVYCEQCGHNVDFVQEGDNVAVAPCEACLERVTDSAAENAWNDGYEAGYNEGYEEGKESNEDEA